MKGLKDVLFTLTNLCLHSIADQLVHGPAFSDVILKQVDKLLGELQSLRITQLRTHTYKNLGSHGAIIYGRDIGIDIICSDGFLMIVHVECGIWGRQCAFRWTALDSQPICIVV